MKRFLSLAVMCLALFAGCLRAAELVGEVAITTAGNTATLAWKTDVLSKGKVKFGLSPEQLGQTALDDDLSTEHSVVLTGLDIGKTYHYTVGSARSVIRSGTFSTGAKAAAPAPDKADTGIVSALKKALLSPRPPPASPAANTAPPTRATWGNMASLQDHYDRHGADFQSTSPDDYAAQAWRFLQRAKRGELQVKRDADGVLRVWDAKTRAFAAYNRDGTTRTYFRPNSPDYFNRQPGESIRLQTP